MRERERGRMNAKRYIDTAGHDRDISLLWHGNEVTDT